MNIFIKSALIDMSQQLTNTAHQMNSIPALHSGLMNLGGNVMNLAHQIETMEQSEWLSGHSPATTAVNAARLVERKPLLDFSWHAFNAPEWKNNSYQSNTPEMESLESAYYTLLARAKKGLPFELGTSTELSYDAEKHVLKFRRKTMHNLATEEVQLVLEASPRYSLRYYIGSDIEKTILGFSTNNPDITWVYSNLIWPIIHRNNLTFLSDMDDKEFFREIEALNRVEEKLFVIEPYSDFPFTVFDKELVLTHDGYFDYAIRMKNQKYGNLWFSHSDQSPSYNAPLKISDLDWDAKHEISRVLLESLAVARQARLEEIELEKEQGNEVAE